jgi:hypothetical protein
MGFCLGELIWEEVFVGVSRNVGYYELRPRLRIHHPQFVRYLYTGTANEGWYLLTRDGFRRVTPGDGQWVLFSLGSDRPWMNGAVLGLAIPWFLRMQVRRDMGRRSELDGIGLRKITGPKEGIDPKIVSRLIRDARNMGNESVIFIPAEYGLDIDSKQTSAQDGFAASTRTARARSRFACSAEIFRPTRRAERTGSASCRRPRNSIDSRPW